MVRKTRFLGEEEERERKGIIKRIVNWQALKVNWRRGCWGNYLIRGNRSPRWYRGTIINEIGTPLGDIFWITHRDEVRLTSVILSLLLPILASYKLVSYGELVTLISGSTERERESTGSCYKYSLIERITVSW